MSPPKPKHRIQHVARKFECPIDPNANYTNTFWCNRDLIPIPPERRLWTWQGYAGYWIVGGEIPNFPILSDAPDPHSRSIH